MTDTLRERVARAMYTATVTAAADQELTVKWENEGRRVRELYLTEADAAIALIRNETLEEAARVADDEAGHCEDTGSPPSDFGNAGRNDAARDIAAAIRALKEKHNV